MKIQPNSQERQEITKSLEGSIYYIKYINAQNKVTWTGYFNLLEEAESCIERRKKILAKRLSKPKKQPHKKITCIEDMVDIKKLGYHWDGKIILKYYVIYYNKKGFKIFTYSNCRNKQEAKELRDKRLKKLRK